MDATTEQQGGAGEEDRDSPDRDTLTSRGLERLLNASVPWVARHRNRVIGHFRIGRLHRFDRAAVLKAMLAGQVLYPKTKPASLGLRRKRR